MGTQGRSKSQKLEFMKIQTLRHLRENQKSQSSGTVVRVDCHCRHHETLGYGARFPARARGLSTPYRPDTPLFNRYSGSFSVATAARP